MARANVYTVQTPAISGNQITWAAPTTATDSLFPGSGRVLLINNASAGVVTVTIPSNLQVHGLTVPDRTVAIPAGQIFGIAFPATTNEQQQADGSVNVNYSTVATVTYAFVQAAV